ncbi:hypothetical protein NL676_028820 [Syzygium grande]|nr:hypothetical protein NL676_028820 [Syzygium grande]
MFIKGHIRSSSESVVERGAGRFGGQSGISGGAMAAAAAETVAVSAGAGGTTVQMCDGLRCGLEENGYNDHCGISGLDE